MEMKSKNSSGLGAELEKVDLTNDSDDRMDGLLAINSGENSPRISAKRSYFVKKQNINYDVQ